MTSIKMPYCHKRIFYICLCAGKLALGVYKCVCFILKRVKSGFAFRFSIHVRLVICKPRYIGGSCVTLTHIRRTGYFFCGDSKRTGLTRWNSDYTRKCSAHLNFSIILWSCSSHLFQWDTQMSIHRFFLSNEGSFCTTQSNSWCGCLRSIKRLFGKHLKAKWRKALQFYRYNSKEASPFHSSTHYLTPLCKSHWDSIKSA